MDTNVKIDIIITGLGTVYLKEEMSDKEVLDYLSLDEAVAILRIRIGEIKYADYDDDCKVIWKEPEIE